MQAALAGYRQVQAVARQVLAEVQAFIRPGMTEASIVAHCDQLQRQFGVGRYWFNDLPAVVLVGPRTTETFAVPYVPSDQVVQGNDLVTIDLNPEIAGCWGDCARSYFVEDGEVRLRPSVDPECIAGAAVEQALHAWLQQNARPEMACDQLACLIDGQIDRAGFERLDQFSHSIPQHADPLQFVQHGDSTALKDLGLFTLEPHLRLKGGRYGFKHEEIYYFDGPQLRLL